MVGMKKKFSRIFGQGATEYLVLLAVVLIIALVSIALLGFFPGMANDAKVAQSQAYWQSATPIAVKEAAARYNSEGEGANALVLVLENTGSYPIQLVAIGPEFGTKSSTMTFTSTEFGDQSAIGGMSFFPLDSPGAERIIPTWMAMVTLSMLPRPEELQECAESTLNRLLYSLARG
jgi:hypothetical protein